MEAVYTTAPDPITGCIISDNKAERHGGGLYACNGHITNCIISNNSAEEEGGGLSECDGPVTNCIISNNDAGCEGGGLADCRNSNVTNCTIIGNIAGLSGDCGSHGGGILNVNEVTNCIIWDNWPDQIGSADVTYSNIQGGRSEAGNINADPLFVDANGPDNIAGTEDDNLRLSFGSPCIDAGSNSAVPIGTVTDLDGRNRFADGDCNTTVIVDMGAYEFSSVYFGDFDSDCDADFYDYAVLAAVWLQNDPLTDIAPTPAGDGIVDAHDLVVLCDNWLGQTTWH